MHAVVSEWQLLADLSFADYLMWVSRDDGVLVCVAQCRPNTAPTVLLSDAVGTTATSEDLPLVAAAFSDVAASGSVWSSENSPCLEACAWKRRKPKARARCRW